MTDHIWVSVGQWLYTVDGEHGATSRTLRRIPSRKDPVVEAEKGTAIELPVGADVLDHVVVRTGGAVAVGRRQSRDGDRRFEGLAFGSRDAGESWHRIALEKPRGLPKSASWPVERFAGAQVAADGILVLAWDDPWLPDALTVAGLHSMCSGDGGESWSYCRVPTSFPALYGVGREVWMAGDGATLRTQDGKKWRRHSFEVAWPDGLSRIRPAYLRCLRFRPPNELFGLLVHWQNGESLDPPDVGVLRSADGGDAWAYLEVLPGPENGDVNERHWLALDLEAPEFSKVLC